MVTLSTLAAPPAASGHADRPSPTTHASCAPTHSNNLIESPVAFLTYWVRVSLTMDFNTNTYDLSMATFFTATPSSPAAPGPSLQNFPIVTNAPFANNITSLNDIQRWSVGADPSGVGFQELR